MKPRYYLFSLVLISSSVKPMDAENELLPSQKNIEFSEEALASTHNHNLPVDLIKEIMDYLPGSSPALQILARYFEPKPTTRHTILTALRSYLKTLPPDKKSDLMVQFFKTVRYDDQKNYLYHFFDDFRDLSRVVPEIKKAIDRADFKEFKRLCDSSKFTQIFQLNHKELIFAKEVIKIISYYEDLVNPFKKPILNKELNQKAECKEKFVAYCIGATLCAFLLCIFYVMYETQNHRGMPPGAITAIATIVGINALITLFWRHAFCCYTTGRQSMAMINTHLKSLRRLNKQARDVQFVVHGQEPATFF